MLQVTILSEGYQVFSGDPTQAVDWFEGLTYSYQPARDGSAPDWLIDLVSVGFRKPQCFEVGALCRVSKADLTDWLTADIAHRQI